MSGIKPRYFEWKESEEERVSSVQFIGALSLNTGRLSRGAGRRMQSLEDQVFRTSPRPSHVRVGCTYRVQSLSLWGTASFLVRLMIYLGFMVTDEYASRGPREGVLHPASCIDMGIDPVMEMYKMLDDR